jgi:ankyrin repeat protein
LLDRGVAVDTRYKHDLTALMWAAGSGQKDAVEMLLRRGANKALKDDRGKTAADIARELGHKEVVALLDAAA